MPENLFVLNIAKNQKRRVGQSYFEFRIFTRIGEHLARGIANFNRTKGSGMSVYKSAVFVLSLGRLKKEQAN